MNFIKNIKGVNTLYNLRLINPSISINGNLIASSYTQPLYNSNGNLYLNFNTNNFNSSGGTLNLNVNQTFNNLITSTITTSNLQVLETIYADEINTNNIYASVGNIENIIATNINFQNINHPLVFTQNNLQVKYDDITIGLNAENELRVDFNGNIATRPYHPITSSKIADLISAFPLLPDATAVANFLGIPQAVYLETDFLGLRVEEDHFSFSNSIFQAKLQLADNIVALDSNLTIGNIWADNQIKSLYLIAESSSTLGNIRCDNINSSGESTMGAMDILSATIQDLNVEGSMSANNLIASTTTLGNTRITDDLLVSADATMGSMNVVDMNIQTLVAEGDTTLNNLQVSSATADYIEGDDLYFTNATLSNLLITTGNILNVISASATVSNARVSNATITNLIMGNIGNGLMYSGGSPNNLTLNLDNGLYITNTDKVGVKKGPGLKFNPDQGGQLEVNLSETGGLSFYTDKILINASTGLQITGNNLIVCPTQSSLQITNATVNNLSNTTADISSANIINTTISNAQINSIAGLTNISGDFVGRGLNISSNKLRLADVGVGLKFDVSTDKLRTSITATSGGRCDIIETLGTDVSIGLDFGTLGILRELQEIFTPSVGIPARIEFWATTRYILQSAELVAATVLLDYLVGNTNQRMRDTVLLGVTDEVLGLTFWQGTVNANLDVVRNIVDNTATVLGTKLNTADVVSDSGNRLIMNTSKSSIYIHELTANNLMVKNSINATAANIQCYALNATTDISSNNLVNVNQTTQVLHTSVSNIIGLTATTANIKDLTVTNAFSATSASIQCYAVNASTGITSINLATTTATIKDLTVTGSLSATASNIQCYALNATTDITSNNLVNVNQTTQVLTVSSANIVSLTSTNANITNTTITNVRATNITSSALRATHISITNTTSTNVISTDITSTNMLITNANIVNATIQNLNFSLTDITLTNLVSTNITSTNVVSTNANMANTTSTNVVSTNITSTNMLSSNANLISITSPNVLITNANVVNTTSTNVVSTNTTSTNMLITNANIVNATIQNLTYSLTDITSTNMLSSNANLLSITSPNVLITNANIVNATIQNLNYSLTDITSTNMLSSNANLLSITSPNVLITNANLLQATVGNIICSQMTASSILTGTISSTRAWLNTLSSLLILTNQLDSTYITASNIIATTGTTVNLVVSSANLVNTSITNLTATNTTLRNLLIKGNTGTIATLITPDQWTSIGDNASLQFGNTNNYIKNTFGTGIELRSGSFEFKDGTNDWILMTSGNVVVATNANLRNTTITNLIATNTTLSNVALSSSTITNLRTTNITASNIYLSSLLTMPTKTEFLRKGYAGRNTTTHNHIAYNTPITTSSSIINYVQNSLGDYAEIESGYSGLWCIDAFGSEAGENTWWIDRNVAGTTAVLDISYGDLLTLNQGSSTIGLHWVGYLEAGDTIRVKTSATTSNSQTELGWSLRLLFKT